MPSKGRFSCISVYICAFVIPYQSPKSTKMMRKPLGGRGREWATESLKLLEAMRELDDSRNFREPLDPLKYPVSEKLYGTSCKHIKSHVCNFFN